MNQNISPAELPFGMHSYAAERANLITHACGIVLSLCGAIYLLVCVSKQHDSVRLTACAVYGLSLIMVYTMSTLSHCQFTPQGRARFRALDQGCIYFLIAGSVTPLAVAYLPAEVCWPLLGVMWTVAVLGFTVKVAFAHRIDAVSVWIYILLGWFPILATKWFIASVPTTGLLWALAGGLFYTFGTIFLVFDHRRTYFHAMWHLCVMAGSTLHYMTNLVYVAQQP